MFLPAFCIPHAQAVGWAPFKELIACAWEDPEANRVFAVGSLLT